MSEAPELPEPGAERSTPEELLPRYLDFFRSTLLRKIEGLTEQQLRSSLLPSGWSPLELVWHLRFVERRWLRWGFLAEPVDRPWGDADERGRWTVPEGMTTAQVVEEFRRECDRSRALVHGVPLDRRARVGGRFPEEKDAPTLSAILFHLFQEYARHVGQLDVVRELTDGQAGE
ncbi:DinB family protein [Streptomyces sp. NPDC005438]|uniref:DinB family protein n=1 Tax=Streptomyces sp. NPDC005438 TaxID=3156880 RepID=UPI0033AD6CC0